MGTGHVDVWWAGPADAHGRLVAVLDDAERMRLARFARDADRNRYLAAHALARLALGETLSVAPDRLRFDRTCTRCGRDHGKPRVVDAGPVEFSITHSGDRVAVAVVPLASIGIDVEQITDRLDPAELAPVVLSRDEQAWLRIRPSGEHRRSLLRYWTRKEAVVKATGHGLSMPPATLTVSPPDAPPRLLSWSEDEPAPAVQLVDLDPDRHHVGCLAVLADEPVAVVEHDARPLLSA